MCISKRGKAISPGSMTLPTMNNWDMNQALSPYLPPDMNTIASGSMMTSSYNQQQGNHGRNGNGNNNYEFGLNSSGPGSNEYSGGGGPLSHLSDSVNSLDPLNAMEKSLNEQVNYYVSKHFFIYFIFNFARLVKFNYIIETRKKNSLNLLL